MRFLPGWSLIILTIEERFMGLFKNFVSQTRKPEEISDVLKSVGFASVKTDHHESKPWITVVARK